MRGVFGSKPNAFFFADYPPQGPSTRCRSGSDRGTPEAAFAQKVRHLRRRTPVQRERVQATQRDVIALARQVRRG
jgi:hypothetical protein